MSDGLLEGVLDSYISMDKQAKSSADWRDMQVIDINGSASEDIALASAALCGTNSRVKAFIPLADGNLLVKTVRNKSNGYITIPVTAGNPTPKLPAISHIKKTGSIASVIAMYQTTNPD
jgi:hypothetical protein